MKYEIYSNIHGNRRVNIGDASYALEVPAGEPNQNTVAAAWEGPISQAASPILSAWLEAATEAGVPLRYAWTGVSNALGHTSGHKPPWNPKATDYLRDWVASPKGKRHE